MRSIGVCVWGRQHGGLAPFLEDFDEALHAGIALLRHENSTVVRRIPVLANSGAQRLNAGYIRDYDEALTAELLGQCFPMPKKSGSPEQRTATRFVCEALPISSTLSERGDFKRKFFTAMVLKRFEMPYAADKGLSRPDPLEGLGAKVLRTGAHPYDGNKRRFPVVGLQSGLTSLRDTGNQGNARVAGMAISAGGPTAVPLFHIGNSFPS